MTEAANQTEKMAISLEAPFQDMADIVLQRHFPKADKIVITDAHAVSMGRVVEDLFNELWVPIQGILLEGGVDDERTAMARKAILLVAWNQVIVDFGGDVQVVGLEDI